MAKVYFAEINWTTKEIMTTFVLGGDTPIGDTTLEADPTSAAAEQYVNSLWKKGNIYKAYAKDRDWETKVVIISLVVQFISAK